MRYEVQPTELMAQPTAVVRGHADVPDIGDFLGRAYGRVMAAAGEQGLDITGAPFGYYRFTDKGGFPIEYDFDWNHFRTSVGVGVEWLAPLGLFRFSYAVPLTYRRSTELNHGDELEGFQFSIGNAF